MGWENNVNQYRNEAYRILFAVIVLVSLMTGITSAASVSSDISYQGNLTNAQGTPLTGTYTVKFSLYNVATGGTELANDTHAVTAANGKFLTTLSFPPQYFNGQALWLGMRISQNPEIIPREAFLPVPYALSALTLKRDVSIHGNYGYFSMMKVLRDNRGGIALDVFATGLNTRGVNVTTANTNSPGIRSVTYGRKSNAVYASTSGQQSPGLVLSTSGARSHGVSLVTSGIYSDGVASSTSGYQSNGVTVDTSGTLSTGVYSNTSGSQSSGVHIITSGDQSSGMFATTSGDESAGVSTYTSGSGSPGVSGESKQSYGVYAITGRADHKYGVFTPDYLYAMGTEVPATDVAEYMPSSGDVSPGTVLVIGTDGRLTPSSTAYDTKVAGIVSTQPGVTLGKKTEGNSGEALIAVSGRVPCKVDATGAPIHAGDLLTTSDRPGYAMKATSPQIGTILGKAMGYLESGTGTIEVIVTLQ